VKKRKQAEKQPRTPAADHEAATRVASAIINPPPDWLIHAIKIATLPILRGEIEGEAAYPAREELLRDFTAMKHHLDALKGRVLRRANWKHIVENWAPFPGVDPKDMDAGQRKLLDGLAYLPGVLQRTLDGLGPYSRPKPHPDTPSPLVACAILIVIAWDAVHGNMPPHTAPRVWAACSVLWEEVGGERRPSWGEAGAKWRDHLRKAKALETSTLFQKWRCGFHNAWHLQEKGLLLR
jgi:hypothetical protein